MLRINKGAVALSKTTTRQVVYLVHFVYIWLNATAPIRQISGKYIFLILSIPKNRNCCSQSN